MLSEQGAYESLKTILDEDTHKYTELLNVLLPLLPWLQQVEDIKMYVKVGVNEVLRSPTDIADYMKTHDGKQPFIPNNTDSKLYALE